ncbi:MAG TPA: hypothetical protein VJH22_06105 [Candidatus Nanoarchaeia archaeon]|nr:hypothetical protein [Candidatus Nanoarchaeia archaeon]
MTAPTKVNSLNRVIFDTNIYGFLAKEASIAQIEPILIHNHHLIVYGCSVIRKELREAPKDARIALLELYDRITKERTLESSNDAETLAEEYYQEAKSKGQKKPWDDMRNDFLIVAIASLNNLDIVFSDDAKTMSSPVSVQAYQVVNLRHNLRPPNLLSYSVLKQSFIPEKNDLLMAKPPYL